jgi:hypothetical protein
MRSAFAVGVVVREEEFERCLARMDNPAAASRNLHPVAHTGHARRDEARSTLDFDHAKETGAGGLEPGVMAEGRDLVEAQLSNHFENCLAGPCGHFPAVDAEIDRQVR